MNKLIDRKDDLAILKRLIDIFPVTAILGARQSGKTTIARQITSNHYFDLENPLNVVNEISVGYGVLQLYGALEGV